jgi:hypothetical protein
LMLWYMYFQLLELLLYFPPAHQSRGRIFPKMSSVDLSGSSGVPWWTATRNGSLSQDVSPMLTNWNVCKGSSFDACIFFVGVDKVKCGEGTLMGLVSTSVKHKASCGLHVTKHNPSNFS